MLAFSHNPGSFGDWIAVLASFLVFAVAGALVVWAGANLVRSQRERNR